MYCACLLHVLVGPTSLTSYDHALLQAKPPLPCAHHRCDSHASDDTTDELASPTVAASPEGMPAASAGQWPQGAHGGRFLQTVAQSLGNTGVPLSVPLSASGAGWRKLLDNVPPWEDRVGCPLSGWAYQWKQRAYCYPFCTNGSTWNAVTEAFECRPCTEENSAYCADSTRGGSG